MSTALFGFYTLKSGRSMPDDDIRQNTKAGWSLFRMGMPITLRQTASGYPAMPSWIITCRNCRVAFEHTKINTYSLANFLDPVKPEIPAEGVQLECPKCGHAAVYKRTDLFYRRDSAFGARASG